MIGALQMELRNILEGDETNEPGARITHNTDIAIDTPQHRDNDEENATVQTEIQGSSQFELGTKVSENQSQIGKTKKDAAKKNERPSRDINRGQGSRIRSESLDCRARNKDKANDIENTAADTPLREQSSCVSGKTQAHHLKKMVNSPNYPTSGIAQRQNLKEQVTVQQRPIMNNVLHRTLVYLNNITIHFLNMPTRIINHGDVLWTSIRNTACTDELSVMLTNYYTVS